MPFDVIRLSYVSYVSYVRVLGLFRDLSSAGLGQHLEVQMLPAMRRMAAL